VPEDDSPPQKPMWRTAPGLSAIAAVMTAIVSAGAFAIGSFRSDADGPTPPPPIASSTTSVGGDTDPASPHELVVYQDSLADRSVGWRLLDGPDCFSRFVPAGFRMKVRRPVSFCTVQATFRPDLVTLSNVRVEVEAEWVRLPRAEEERGSGAAGLRCRGVGPANTGSFYTGVISDAGWWQIDKWEGAQAGADPDASTSTPLASGSYPPGAWGQGDTVRLALECTENGEGLVLALSVDGQSVGAASDPDPLPPGDVGLAAYEFLGPIEVEFHRLVVVDPTGVAN
jgi:hypothetical protein